MSFQRKLEKYADIALKKGVHLQQGQGLIINAPIEAADFVRTIGAKAYGRGAKDVHMEWSDEMLNYMKLKNAPMEVLEHFPEWKAEGLRQMVADGYALLSIYGPDPDLLKDVDSERVAKANKASAEALTEYRDYVMNDKTTWSVIAYPQKAWAKKVFPDDSADKAQEKLWEQIFHITRIDQEDAVQAWEDHNDRLRKIREFLNGKQYKKLHYKGPGTDLSIELVQDHIWHGGSAVSEGGVEFNPNIPTEEVFTMPHKNGVQGTVTSTKPLNYGGNLIDNFTLTFQNGMVVDFSAESGEETLKHLLEMDNGAKRLGEVALVPHESPISQSGHIFFNTLYDENASCHLALGKAYPTNVAGGSGFTKEQMDHHGVNDSLIHEDFMMGSGALDIDGETHDGSYEPIFRKGAWAIPLED
ncbi:aminopeptidase [Halobacillus sp. ACCC02827]|uniref:aminopeptidase n=1 Tax=Bacillaceae TaxID=186817 RepID=UPI0002A5144E|nr:MULTISPECIES: aminopeptidase [Bacillaceae]ELK48980.1 M29 family aminopeptidase [Halobacillus sp. BAB-2008]QHT48226.1 aminopeptidase [Bacillus sp. SB49]WJE15459.1 aminopeptidase [Halobacillus sp. ACCC02827]